MTPRHYIVTLRDRRSFATETMVGDPLRCAVAMAMLYDRAARRKGARVTVEPIDIQPAASWGGPIVAEKLIRRLALGPSHRFGCLVDPDLRLA